MLPNKEMTRQLQCCCLVSRSGRTLQRDRQRCRWHCGSCGSAWQSTMWIDSSSRHARADVHKYPFFHCGFCGSANRSGCFRSRSLRPGCQESSFRPRARRRSTGSFLQFSTSGAPPPCLSLCTVHGPVAMRGYDGSGTRYHTPAGGIVAHIRNTSTLRASCCFED
jgi:hypothetical protein